MFGLAVKAYLDALQVATLSHPQGTSPRQSCARERRSAILRIPERRTRR